MLNATTKYPQLAKKHASLISNFPLRKYNVFFNKQYPYKLCRNPLKDSAFVFEKAQSSSKWYVSLQVRNIPVPYVARFSIYSHLFLNAEFMSKRAISRSCKMAMLLKHGKYPTIRQFSFQEAMFLQKKKILFAQVVQYSCWKGSVFLVSCSFRTRSFSKGTR